MTHAARRMHAMQRQKGHFFGQTGRTGRLASHARNGMAVHLWCIHDLARFGRAGGKSGQKGRQGASIALKWPVFWPLVNHRSTKQL